MKQPSPLWLFILLLHPPVTTPCGTYFGSAAYQVHAPTPSTVAIRAGPTPVLDSSVDSSTNKFGYTLRFYEASNGEFFYRIKNTLPLQGCTGNCIQFFSKKQNDDLIMKENEYQGACFQYEQDPDSNFALSLGIPDTASKSFVQFDNTDLRFEKGPSFPVFWWMLPMKQNGAGSAISPLQVAFEIQCRRKRSVYSYGNSGRRYSTTHTRRRTSRRNINGRQGSSRNRNIQHPTRGTSHRNSNNNNRNNNRNNNNNNNRNNNNNNNRNNSRNNNRNNSRNKNMMVSSGCGTEENVAVHNIVRGGRAATLDTIKFRSNVSNPSEFFPASTRFDIKQFITYNTPLFYDRRRKQYFLTAYETVAIRIPNSPWYLEVEEATQPGRQSREAEDESTVKPPSRLTNFRRTTGTPLQLSYSPIGFGRYEGNLRRETKCTRQFGCQKTPSVTGVNLTAQQHVDRRMFLVHRIGDKVRFESILSPGVFLAFLKRRNDEKLVATRLHNDKSLMFDFNADRFPRLQGRPLKVNVSQPSRYYRSRNNRQRRRGQGYRG